VKKWKDYQSRGEKMKFRVKKSTLLLMLFIFSIFGRYSMGLSFMPQEPKEEAADPKTLDYNKAVTAKTPEERIRLFNEYLKKWSNSIYHKYVYAQLCLNYYQIKKFNEAIKAGEKALTYPDLEPDWRGQILLVLADCCASNPANKDYQKSLNYINRAIKIAEENNLYRLAQTAKNAKNAVLKLINIGKLGKIKSLYEQKKYSQVISIIESMPEKERNKFEVLRFYALSLYKTGKPESALNSFRKAYSIKKTGEMANLMAIILYGKSKKNKKLLDEAIKYFIIASKLFAKENNKKMSDKALARAQFLFFNDKYKINKRIKEIEEKYKGVEEKYNSLVREYNALVKKYENVEEIPKDVEKKMDQMKRQIEELEIKLEDKEIALEDLQNEHKRLIKEFNKLLIEIRE
jgi:tetratricopeptide (TPR) repeat protein